MSRAASQFPLVRRNATYRVHMIESKGCAWSIQGLQRADQKFPVNEWRRGAFGDGNVHCDDNTVEFQNAQHCLLGRSEGMYLGLWSLGLGRHGVPVNVMEGAVSE